MRHIRRRSDGRRRGGRGTLFAALVGLVLTGCGSNPQGPAGESLGLWDGNTTGTPGVYTPQVKGANETAGVLTVNTTLLDFGDADEELALELRNSGGGALSYRIRGDVSWVTVEPQEGTLNDETDRVAVRVDRSGLTEGAHAAALSIESDTAAPLEIQIRVTVASDGGGGTSQNAAGRLYVSTSALNFGATARSLSFLVRNRGDGALEYNVTADAAWISIVGGTGASGGEYDAVRVSVSRTGLAPGDYAANVAVNGGGEQAVIAVRMHVDEAASRTDDGPELYVTPVELNFGPTQTRLTFLVRNVGTGRLNYTVTPRVSWAVSSVTSASNSGRYDAVRITVDRAGLAPGDYEGTVAVEADNGQAQAVVVRLTVPATGDAGGGDPPPALEVSTNLLDFGAQNEALFFTLRNGGGGKLTYSISSNAAWAVAAPAAGDSAGETDTIQVTADRKALPPGSHQAALTVLTDTGELQEITLLLEQTETGDSGGGGGTGNSTSLVEWPSSDARIDNITDLSQYALRNAPYWYGFAIEQWSPVPLVSLLVVHSGVGNHAYWLDQLRQTLVGANPAAVYGTYISGGDCRKQADMRFYPNETVPYEALPPGAYRTEYNSDGDDRAIVDVANPATAALYADLIVNEIAARRMPTAFLDNIRHPHSDGKSAPWATMMQFIGGIRARLNAAGTRVVINIAGLPWAMDATDAQLLQDAVDGMCFEMPFHRHIRGSADAISGEIDNYRRWLDADKTVQLIATWVPDGGQRDDQRTFVAAMTMMIRRPGDSIFVARGFYEDAPAWADWPTRFGAALGDYEFVPDQPSVVVRREFEHATLTVDVTATLDAAQAATAVTVEWK